MMLTVGPISNSLPPPLVTDDTVLFFQTDASIEPVAFVHSLCERIQEKPERRTSRFAQRLTPVAATSKARPNGIAEIASAVLAPYFHASTTAPETETKTEPDTEAVTKKVSFLRA